MRGRSAFVVIERIRAMLEAGTIRRVRQTLLATNLAQGALIAWKIDDSLIDAAFDFIAKRDPEFTGGVEQMAENLPGLRSVHKLDLPLARRSYCLV